MTTSGTSLSGQPSPQFEEHTIQAEASAQKRAQVQLSARRPTAKKTVQRPPDPRQVRSKGAGWLTWAVVSLLVLLLLVNVWLVTAMMFGTPLFWPWSGERTAAQEVGDSGLAATSDAAGGDASGQADSAAAEYELRTIFADDFTRPTAPLAQDLQPEQWDMGFVRQDSVYRMRVWPGWAAVSILAPSPPRYRLEADVTIAVETPQGYAGILGRYQDDQSMYMFNIDGQGRYRVQLQQSGEWRTLQPWTDDMDIQLAGESNTIALEDRGDLLRFLVNDVVKAEVEPQLPQIGTGLVTGAPSDSRVGIAESNFHRVALYELIEQ
jgi:hypothetical protein